MNEVLIKDSFVHIPLSVPEYTGQPIPQCCTIPLITSNKLLSPCRKKLSHGKIETNLSYNFPLLILPLSSKVLFKSEQISCSAFRSSKYLGFFLYSWKNSMPLHSMLCSTESEIIIAYFIMSATDSLENMRGS